MPLFNESLESIAEAIVTVTRALEEGVIEEKKYKGLNEYLAKRAKDFNIKKSHLAQADNYLAQEIKMAVKELYVEVGDELYKMAEEILDDFNGNDDIEKEEDGGDKQAAACAAWAKMDDEERAAMAALASAWQKSR